MSYRIKRKEDPGAALRRVCSEQIEKALGEVANDGFERDERVHQVRKRCKKLRGALRLYRPALGKRYKKENARFRNIGRGLSGARDAQVAVETFELLMAELPAGREAGHFDAVRDGLLAHRRDVLARRVDLSRRLLEAEKDLRRAWGGVADWRLGESGFEAVRGGLKKTYKRARKSMARAYSDPSPEAFHEWRKRVKYHWHHVRLLRNVWKAPMQERRSQLKDLSDLLGEDHDLANLRALLEDDPERFGGARLVGDISALAAARRRELQAEACRLGTLVYAETPKAFTSRCDTYWQAWRGGTKKRARLCARL